MRTSEERARGKKERETTEAIDSRTEEGDFMALHLMTVQSAVPGSSPHTQSESVLVSLPAVF